jgi:hypothetical protein
MIDRAARDKLIALINAFLDEEVTAFQFDDQLDDIECGTKDETVWHVRIELWYHYDDLTNHLVVLEKVQWDYFQRLVLLLQSDAEIRTTTRWHWSARQMIAVASLVLHGLSVHRLGWILSLVVVGVPLGFVSLALSLWSGRSRRKRPTPRFDLIPFASLGEIRTLRESMPDFRKRTYPPDLADRNDFARRLESVTNTFISECMGRMLIEPLVLLSQAFPERESHVRVSLPIAQGPPKIRRQPMM